MWYLGRNSFCVCSSDKIPIYGQKILFELVLKVSTRTRDTIIFADTENACGKVKHVVWDDVH